MSEFDHITMVTAAKVIPSASVSEHTMLRGQHKWVMVREPCKGKHRVPEKPQTH